YLSEIAETNRKYDGDAKIQSEIAQQLYGIYKTILSVLQLSEDRKYLSENGIDREKILKMEVADDKKTFIGSLLDKFHLTKKELLPSNWETILDWENTFLQYK